MTLQWRHQPPHSLIAGPWRVQYGVRPGWYGLWRDGVLIGRYESRQDALNEAERRHAAESVPVVKVWDC